MDYILKNLHFIFTHVPIALLIFSFVFDVVALIFKKKEWHSAGMLCLVVGALGAIASVLTGPSHGIRSSARMNSTQDHDDTSHCVGRCTRRFTRLEKARNRPQPDLSSLLHLQRCCSLATQGISAAKWCIATCKEALA